MQRRANQAARVMGGDPRRNPRQIERIEINANELLGRVTTSPPYSPLASASRASSSTTRSIFSASLRPTAPTIVRTTT